MKKQSLLIDIVALSFLSLFTVLFALRLVDFSIRPFEDAAILMRYAEHFANGFGIVWNVGEKPVDGATDFLFLVSLGWLVRLGLSLEFAARCISFSSHMVTVWIVYVSLRKLCHAPLLLALISAMYLAMGRGIYYVAAYLGTPLFALFACITWYFALTIIQKGENWKRSCLFSASSLVLGLIRPEGVILSGLMVTSIVYICGLRSTRSTVTSYLAIFLLIGGPYFLLRWQYFGFPLPNAFYKKGDWKIHFDGLYDSIVQTLRLCVLLLPAYIYGIYSSKAFRFVIGFSIVIIGFASAFVLLSPEMNFGGRFQYVLLPLGLMSWWLLIADMKEKLNIPNWNEMNLQRRAAAILAFLVLSIGIFGYQFKKGPVVSMRDGRYDVAVSLSDYAGRGFTIATSEAGLLPLYSRWRSLDTWGLNDIWLAHNGTITQEYLDSFKPTIIMFRASFSPLVCSDKGGGEWLKMVRTLKSYAEKKGYVLAAVFGDSPYETHYYYVRPDSPESQEIIRRIRITDYYWYATGRRAINYALLSVGQ
jgi:arabinofuranosyltransferase